jgi:hypothetical protein
MALAGGTWVLLPYLRPAKRSTRGHRRTAPRSLQDRFPLRTPSQGAAKPARPLAAAPAAAAPALQAEPAGEDELCGSEVPSSPRPSFVLSVARPRSLAKGYASLFLVQLRTTRDDSLILAQIRRAFAGAPADESRILSSAASDNVLEITLQSPDIEFSGPVRKRIRVDGLEVALLGKPRVEAKPGVHPVILTIAEAETELQIDTLHFSVAICDYAFDHISRPLVATTGSLLAGAASCATFALASMGAIDSAFGLASGSAGLALMAFLAGAGQRLYRAPRVVDRSLSTSDIG